MLAIRRTQKALFDTVLREGFESRMLGHLQRTYPIKLQELRASHPGDEPVRELIREGIQKARRHGIVAEVEVETYLDFMVELGPEFETLRGMEWAREILQTDRYSGSVKIQLIEKQLPARRPAPDEDRGSGIQA